MKIRGLAKAVLASGVIMCVTGSAHAGAIYDMSVFLNQTHPFEMQQPSTGASTTTPVVVRSSVPVVTPPRPAASSTGSNVTVSQPAAEMAQAGGSSRFGQRSDGNNGWGAISEVRLGVLNHDEGPFSSNKEADSPDFNGEVLFVSPDMLDIIWSPRPHIGASINSGDDTSQVYAGLSWEWFLWGDIFAGFSLGGAVHDGETTLGGQDPKQNTKKELGCSLLFRESVEIGWMMTENHGISLILDHISNAKLCDENEGLENMGVRYGYRF